MNKVQICVSIAVAMILFAIVKPGAFTPQVCSYSEWRVCFGKRSLVGGKYLTIGYERSYPQIYSVIGEKLLGEKSDPRWLKKELTLEGSTGDQIKVVQIYHRDTGRVSAVSGQYSNGRKFYANEFRSKM